MAAALITRAQRTYACALTSNRSIAAWRPRGLTYARFMDDWVVLASTRWALRRAIVIINETLRELRVEPHPDKTSTGRIERVAWLYKQNPPPELAQQGGPPALPGWR